MKKTLFFCLFTTIFSLKAETSTYSLGKYALYGLSGISGSAGIALGLFTCYHTFDWVYDAYQRGFKIKDLFKDGSYAPSELQLKVVMISALAFWTAVPLGIAGLSYKAAQKL